MTSLTYIETKALSFNITNNRDRLREVFDEFIDNSRFLGENRRITFNTLSSHLLDIRGTPEASTMIDSYNTSMNALISGLQDIQAQNNLIQPLLNRLTIEPTIVPPPPRRRRTRRIPRPRRDEVNIDIDEIDSDNDNPLSDRDDPYTIAGSTVVPTDSQLPDIFENDGDGDDTKPICSFCLNNILPHRDHVKAFVCDTHITHYQCYLQYRSSANYMTSRLKCPECRVEGKTGLLEPYYLTSEGRENASS